MSEVYKLFTNFYYLWFVFKAKCPNTSPSRDTKRPL